VTRDAPARSTSFDLIARVLAAGLQRREPTDDLRAALTGRSRAYWQGVLDRARGEFVLAAFAAAIKDLGLHRALQPQVRGFLAVAHAANVQRNDKLREQLAALLSRLNQAGIEPVLLKGAIRLVDGLYPDPGWRTLQDLDILVPEAQFTSTLDALQSAGYAAVRPADHTCKDVKLRRQGLADVEIHRELFGPAKQRRLLAGAEVIGNSRPAAVVGAAVRVPSTAHQLVHLIGHGQIGHRGYAYGRIALRDRLEAAALMRRATESIDWPTVFTCFAAAGYRRPLLVFLLSLADGSLCAAPVPGPIDTLTILQKRRIALQARSPAMMRLSLHISWCAVLLDMQTMEHEAGGPKMVHTLKKLVRDREERRRLLRTFRYGAPRPW